MRFLLASLLSLCCSFAHAQDTSTAKPMSLEEAHRQVTEGTALLIDVRSKAERDDGYLEIAKHIPFYQVKAAGADAKVLAELPKDKPLFIHCAKGKRAAKAAAHLTTLGYKAHALELDFEEVRDAGFKEIKPES